MTILGKLASVSLAFSLGFSAGELGQGVLVSSELKPDSSAYSAPTLSISWICAVWPFLPICKVK